VVPNAPTGDSLLTGDKVLFLEHEAGSGRHFLGDCPRATIRCGILQPILPVLNRGPKEPLAVHQPRTALSFVFPTCDVKSRRRAFAADEQSHRLRVKSQGAPRIVACDGWSCDIAPFRKAVSQTNVLQLRVPPRDMSQAFSLLSLGQRQEPKVLSDTFGKTRKRFRVRRSHMRLT